MNDQPSGHFFFPGSGVRPGLHMGPVMYLVHFNDIAGLMESIGVHCLLYADDTEVPRKVNSQEKENILQNAIDALVEWSEANRLTLNVKKTVHLKFFKSRVRFSSRHLISGHQLDTSESHKDLGVVFDSLVKFCSHTELISKRAAQLNGAIFRLSKDIGFPRLAFNLFKVFVLPIFEYGSVVWNCDLITCNHKVESALRVRQQGWH